jgi:multidrug resistance protein, MATE family
MRAMFKLSVPIVVAQVGMMTMGAVDTMMVGRISGESLAAVALGNLYYFAVVVFGMGILMALDPVIAQAVGARDNPAISRGMQRGLLLAAVISVPTMLLLLPGEALLSLLRQPEGVIPVAAQYARASIPGVFPFLAFVVLRQSLQAMERLGRILVTIVLANLLNALLNWMLIFGALGAPEMGAVGSGWASSGSRWFMALALLAIAWRDLRPFLIPLREDSFRVQPLLRMIRLGVPIGVHYSFEMGAFTMIGLLMGWLGMIEMAAHHVAVNLASLTFMVPMGVGGAAAVLVGQAVGRGDPVAARSAAGAALAYGLGFMTLSAIVFLSMPYLLARVYTIDEAVIAVAVVLIPLAGIFQIFDGMQVVSLGVLRGVGDTRTPMIVAMVGYWLIGIPVSAYLGLHIGTGATGLWWGLVIGLGIVAILLLIRVHLKLTGDLRRVVVDEALDATTSEHALDELAAEYPRR